MGDLKEKKGFTLIELLAVIVILAIVTVIGATTVLPYIRNAKESAFADEVHYVIEAASNAINLKNLHQIDNDNFTSTTSNDITTYCITIEKLVDLGLWTKDASAIYNATSNATGKYKGKVLISEAGEGYSYSVSMTSGDYYVKDFGSTNTVDDVASSEPSGISYTCS